MEYDVSVIICTYNSSIERIKETLFSVINQKGVSFEIIITDDGSSVFQKEAIEEYFKIAAFHDYKLLSHNKNRGTVYNLYDGLSVGCGKYCFCVSPGDIIYNEFVLKELFDYSEKEQFSTVFSDVACYKVREDGEHIAFQLSQPLLPELFNMPSSLNSLKLISLFYGNNPVGASYFREKQSFIISLFPFLDKVIYLEDKSSTAFLLLYGGAIGYYSKPIVWYEHGTGISTGASTYWAEKIKNDNMAIFDVLYHQFPYSRYLKTKKQKNRFLRIVCYFDVYLLIAAWKIVAFFQKKRKRVSNSYDYSFLNQAKGLQI